MRWRGNLAKVASWRRLGLGRAEGEVASWRRLGLERAEGVSVAWGGPRTRRESSGVGRPCPRLGSGEARSCPLSGPSLDLNRTHQAFAALCWWGLPAEIRSLGSTLNYGPRQSQIIIRLFFCQVWLARLIQIFGKNKNFKVIIKVYAKQNYSKNW
jgi:hypothetical protein